MLELTLENFENEVLNSDELVFVDWWGETCENCLALMPTVEQLAQDFDGKLKFTKFNASQKGVKRFCIQQRILGLPVMSLYKNGEKIAEVAKDDCTKEKIEEMINDNL